MLVRLLKQRLVEVEHQSLLQEVAYEILKPSESEISTDHNAIMFDLKTECISLSRARELFSITVKLIWMDYVHVFKLSIQHKKSQCCYNELLTTNVVI